MDLVTRTSLEALLLKATSSSNQNIDTAAVEAFCTLINKEKDGAYIGSVVIADRLHCGVEKEVMQTLNVLDNCMSRCGTHFQSEIGKFRFLNEMIKLVSPKYLGCQTPTVVKQKVLQLLYVWTLDFPKETKIKEAYDMLRKQGVIKEIPNPNIAIGTDTLPKRVNSIFNDTEKSKRLQKLLQSKDPEDVRAANWLIKSMVKEDEKRVELKSRRAVELESAQNNIRLLNEMLDSYIAETSSKDEMELIKELYQSCERLQPNLAKLAAETSQNDDVLGDILQLNDELTQVFAKYKSVIIEGNFLRSSLTEETTENDLSLLNFDLMSTETNSIHETCTKGQLADTSKTNMDVLSDIFDTPNIPDVNVLKPIQLKTECKEPVDNKFKALDDLDILKDHLKKENLSSETWTAISNSKFQDKTPLNLLLKKNEMKRNTSNTSVKETCPLNFDLSLLNNPKNNNTTESSKQESLPVEMAEKCLVNVSDVQNLLSKEKLSPEETTLNKTIVKIENEAEKPKMEVKLKDIHIELKDIRPSSIAPVTVLEKNQVLVTLYHAKDQPKDDVKVFVVTTVNKNDQPLSSYLLQAVVPKHCKLKLQAPSGTDLPPLNPFLPPSAITQIMLIGNPEGKELNVKFVLSYMMEDETVTEMGEISNLWVD